MGKEDKATFGGAGKAAIQQRENFCNKVKKRFATIYKVWYDGIGLKEALSFDDVVSQDESVMRAKFILEVFEKLKKRNVDNKIGLYGLEIGGGGLEKSIENHLFDVLRHSWVSAEVVFDDWTVAFTLNLSGLDIEFGIRKIPEKQSTEKDVRERIAKVELKDMLPCKFDKSENQYWYAYSGVFADRKLEGPDAVEDVSEAIQKLVDTIKSSYGVIDRVIGGYAIDLKYNRK